MHPSSLPSPPPPRPSTCLLSIQPCTACCWAHLCLHPLMTHIPSGSALVEWGPWFSQSWSWGARWPLEFCACPLCLTPGLLSCPRRCGQPLSWFRCLHSPFLNPHPPAEEKKEKKGLIQMCASQWNLKTCHYNLTIITEILGTPPPPPPPPVPQPHTHSRTSPHCWCR